MKIKHLRDPGEHWAVQVEPDLTLRGVDLRHPERPTLHFVHGVAFASKLYWPVLRELVDENGLFLQDLQGHGDSDTGDSYPGWEASIDRIVAVMDAKGLDNAAAPVVGMGHSYGASLHMLMAAAEPERFSALVLLDPMLMPQNMFELFTKLENNPMIDRVRKKSTRWDDRETAREYLRSKHAFKRWTDESIDAFIDHAMWEDDGGGVSLRCPPELEIEVLAKPLLTLWDAVERLNVPTVILYGNDRMSPIGPSCRKAAELNPCIEAVEMTGSHNFMLEHPQETAAQIRAALNRLDAALVPEKSLSGTV